MNSKGHVFSFTIMNKDLQLFLKVKGTRYKLLIITVAHFVLILHSN